MPRTLNRPFVRLTESPGTRSARRQRFLFRVLVICSGLGIVAFLASCGAVG